MPDVLDRCVEKVKKQKDVENPWSICTQSLQDAGKLPKKKESDNYHHEPAMLEPGYWDENPSSLPFPDNCPVCDTAMDWHYGDDGKWIPCAVLTGDIEHSQMGVESSQIARLDPTVNQLADKVIKFVREESLKGSESNWDILENGQVSLSHMTDACAGYLNISGRIDMEQLKDFIEEVLSTNTIQHTAALGRPTKQELIERLEFYERRYIELDSEMVRLFDVNASEEEKDKLQRRINALENRMEETQDALDNGRYELVPKDFSRISPTYTLESKKAGFTTGLDQYLQTILWAETDGDQPLDKKYNVSDFSPEARQQAERDVDSFMERATALFPQDQEVDSTDLAHDFWLTRAGHGAGFWDGDWGDELGKKLTELSKSFGYIDVYVGDDGKIYFSGGSVVSKVAAVGVISKEEANSKFPVFLADLVKLAGEQFPHEVSNKFKKIRETYAQYLPIWRESVAPNTKGLMLCIQDLSSWGSDYELMPYIGRMLSLYGGTIQTAIAAGSLDRISRNFVLSHKN